jgi:hypothetical protein
VAAQRLAGCGPDGGAPHSTRGGSLRALMAVCGLLCRRGEKACLHCDGTWDASTLVHRTRAASAGARAGEPAADRRTKRGSYGRRGVQGASGRGRWEGARGSLGRREGWARMPRRAGPAHAWTGERRRGASVRAGARSWQD